MSENLEKALAKDSLGPRIIAAEDQLAPLPEAVYNSKKAPKYPSAVVANTTYQYARKGTVREKFAKLEYNLTEIAKSEHTESYVMRSFQKHVTLMLKGGWHLDGRNPKTIAYIYDRIRELEVNANLPFDELLQETVQSLVAYSNAFIVFVRENKRSSGKRLRRYGTMLAPIAAAFPADPTTFKARIDSRGRVEGWKQDPSGTYSSTDEYSYANHSVLHAYYNRKPGFIAGTPWIVPALDDIRSWRRLEELSEIMSNRFSFPLLHYKIGNDKYPAEEYDRGPTEIQQAKEKIQSLPSDGVFITPHRHDISAVGTDQAMLDLEPYMKYWEARVISGLNLSALDLGRGDSANKATAQQLSKGLADFCTDLQRALSRFFKFGLFDKLLEEGGYKLTAENRIEIKFPVIDTADYVLLEKHNQHMFSMNSITESEMRRRLGLQPITEAMRKEMYFALYDIKADELAHKQNMEVAKVSGNSTGQSSSPSRTSQIKRKNKAENVNRPTNQEGKLTSKTKPVRDAVLNEWLSISSKEDTKQAKDAFLSKCIELITPVYTDSLKAGMDACGALVGDSYDFVGDSLKDRFINTILKDKFIQVFDAIHLERHETSKLVRISLLEMSAAYIERILDSADSVAYNCGFLFAANLNKDVDSVVWKNYGGPKHQVQLHEACFDTLSLLEGDKDILVLNFKEDSDSIMTDREFGLWHVAKSLVDNGSLNMDTDKYLSLLSEIATIGDKRLTTKQRETLKSSTFCGPNRSFPVSDCNHYTTALEMIDHYKGPGDKSSIRARIDKRGKSLKCSSSKSTKNSR